MTKRFAATSKLEELEYEINKIKFIQSKFPDVQCRYDMIETKPFSYTKSLKFFSKTVNVDFEKLDFQSKYNTLYAIPYCEMIFNYNNTSETIRILPIPEKIILAKKSHKRVSIINNTSYQNLRPTYHYEDIIKFSRFSVNNKKNAFNQDRLYQECMLAILDFVKKYRDIKTDVKNLDPRLKKLLAFS